MSDVGCGGLVPSSIHPRLMAKCSPDEYAEMSRAVEAGCGYVPELLCALVIRR